MHQNKRWSPSCDPPTSCQTHIGLSYCQTATTNPAPSANSGRMKEDNTRKWIYNETFHQSDHHTHLTLTNGENRNFGRGEYHYCLHFFLFFLGGREFHKFNCFCFVYVPMIPFWKYNHCWPSNHDLTWSDIYEWVNSCNVKIDKLANVQILPSHK